MSPKVVERHLLLSRVVLLVYYIPIITSESLAMIMNLYAISLYLLISCLTSVNADFPTASNKSYFGVIKHFQSGSCFHAVDKKIVLSVIYHDCMLNL